MSAFSLPTQRCFPVRWLSTKNGVLFSAYAEVFLSHIQKKVSNCPFLCLRRGVSYPGADPQDAEGFSLPTQRCFLWRHPEKWQGNPFLCLRRGVSDFGSILENIERFSLPTQRCFRLLPLGRPSPPLFSAYAEVFRISGLRILGASSFLCLRRGVSEEASRAVVLRAFSLPTQRCFSEIATAKTDISLFSAYAEVFRHQ